MLKRCTIIAVALILANTLSFANSRIPAEAKAKFKENVSKMTAEERRDAFLKANPRQPIKNSDAIKKLKRIPQTPANSNTNKENSLESIPVDAVFPAEFEELDAVLVTWSYNSFDKNGEWVSPLFPNLYMNYNPFTQVVTLDSCYSELCIDEEDPYTWLYADLVNAIQTETQVWINVWFPEDTTVLKNFMTEIGMPLTNYKFFINHGNSFWYRDCGPVAFYYNDYQEVGFLDFEYYPGRPLDDKIPEFIANELGILNVKTTVEFEGGNLLTDGLGTLFTSTAIAYGNTDTEGQWIYDPTQDPPFNVIEKTPLTLEQVKDSLKMNLNQTNCYVMPMLNYDGGTGHIDLYADFFDENQFVFTKFPDELSKLTDYAISKANCEELIKITNYHGKNYTNKNIPLPRKDDGSWYKSNNDYQRLTRTFTNHLVLNKSIIQPVFHNTINGDKSGDEAAIEEIKKAYPGYKIIPIDMRALDGSGGSIHCITKQIPAKDPIRIFHSPLQYADLTDGKYIFDAEIINHNGIKNANIRWRYKGNTAWEAIELNKTELGYQAELYASVIPENNIIEYYIEAEDNNGKIVSKPITAPDGFYVIAPNTLSVEDEMRLSGEFYPNPANSEVNLQLNIDSDSPISIEIYDIRGEVTASQLFTNNYSGNNLITINVTPVNDAPTFNAVFKQNGNLITSKTFVVSK